MTALMFVLLVVVLAGLAAAFAYIDDETGGVS